MKKNQELSHPTSSSGRLTSSEAIVIVGRREISTRLRSKSFLIGVFTTVLLVAIGVGLGPLLDSEDQVKLGLAGDTPVGLTQQFESNASAAEITADFTTFESVEEAEAEVEEGNIDGVLVDGHQLIVNRNDPQLQAMVGSAKQQNEIMAELEGLDPALEMGTNQDELLSIRELDPDPDRGSKEGVSIFLPGMLFLAVQMAGAYIMMGVLEEKGSRIVELLLSSIRARDLLIGKILGIGVAGLTQVLAITITAVATATATGSSILPVLTPAVLFWGLVWFLVGYLMYGTLFAAGASLAPRAEDAQSALAPVTIILMFGYFGSVFAAISPDSAAAEVISYIPFVAPFTMPGRLALGNANAMQLVAALVGSLITTGAIVLLAERIYVRSVMETERALSWKQAWKRNT